MTTPHTKQLRTCIKAASAPTDAQLAAIRQYTLRDFTADELMVRSFVLAHNGIDRDGECFDEPLLQQFADDMPGKGCYIKHPTSWDGDGGPAEGRVFGAHVERMSFDAARTLLRSPNLQFPPDRTEAAVLMPDVFFVRTPDNASLLTKMDAGIAGDTSIGFSATGPVAVKDATGRELTAKRWSMPGEGVEMSLVWLGAQQGARAIKHASNSTEPQKEKAMTPEEIKALQTEAAANKAAAEANAKAAAQLADLRKALGDDAAMLDSADALKTALANAKAYRKSLIDDIVAIERHLKLVGDGEEEIKAAQELYADFPVAKLQKTLDAMQKRRGGGKTAGDKPNSGSGDFQEQPDGAVNEKAAHLKSPLLVG